MHAYGIHVCTNVQCMAYTYIFALTIVSYCLEYASIVWNPHTSVDAHVLEMVQNRAARWICASWNPVIYAWSKSIHDCLRELSWPSLAQRRVYFIVDYFHSILHHRNSFLFHDYFTFKTTSTRSHQLTVQPIQSSINAFRFSFFVNSIFLWNSIPYNILNTKCKHHFRCRLRSYLL